MGVFFPFWNSPAIQFASRMELRDLFSPSPFPTFGRSDLQTPVFAGGDKVMNAIVRHESGYCGELSLSSMTKNYLEAAIEIAQEAGKILVEELSRPLDLAYKGDEVDLVTQADKRSEKFIVERLTKYFPEHAIAAEEGTGMRVLQPRNFAGTSIRSMAPRILRTAIRASAFRSRSPSGIRCSPRRSSILFTTNSLPPPRRRRHLQRQEIHVSKNATLSSSLLCTGFPVRNRKLSPNLQYYGDFTQHSHGVRRDGSAALDLASVACGRFDGFWEFGLAKWDVAAGILLIEEAGGKVSDFAGNPYQLGGPSSSPPTV